MVGYGSQEGTKSIQLSSTTPSYLPGQLSYLPSYLKPFQDIYAGNLGLGSVAEWLRSQSTEEGKQAAAEGAATISKTPGQSAPAKAKGMMGLMNQIVSAAAGVPGQMFGKATDVLGQYVFAPPAYISSGIGKSSGGGGTQWNICHILLALNGGKLEDSLRRFRDAYLSPNLSLVRGYKKMARWLVPLIYLHPFIKTLGRLLILNPLTQVARWKAGQSKVGFVFLPIVWFWIKLWEREGL